MSLRDLYEQYRHRVQFLVIYIREAHPMDGWYLGGLEVQDPRTMLERRRVAGQCQLAMKYGIPTYVDEMDDGVMKSYAAWPDRLYLISSEGQVVYKGGIGPLGFKPGRLKKAIDDHLAKRVGEQAAPSRDRSAAKGFA